MRKTVTFLNGFWEDQRRRGGLYRMVRQIQGCASASEGTDQTITVETSPTGANCRFYRQETGIVAGQVITPGDVVIEKTEDDMTVECEKEGYETVKANLESEIEGATWGDIILGWAIERNGRTIRLASMPMIAATMRQPGQNGSH